MVSYKCTEAEMERNMKLAVFFPGIGYHCDKPLLYYSAKIAGQYQYEVCRVSYAGLGKAIDEALAGAICQAEQCLQSVEWKKYEEILFVSKSIGTAVACAYAKKHGIRCRNIYYTPLEETFDFAPQPGIAFHGTKDSWAGTAVVSEKCRQHNLPLYIVEEGNHSLEAVDDVRRSLRILSDVMERTLDYIAEGVSYRKISCEEIDRALFRQFIRRQKVTDCRRKEKGEWVIRQDPFIDDWSEEDYKVLVSCLKNTAETDGFVYGAFCNEVLKGFVSVEAGVFGAQHGYLDLSSIHVSEDMRGRGIGKALFKAAAEWAAKRGARKLYISAHSAVETQAFYQAMGCVEAELYHQEHVEREPYDCQLEFVL